MQTLRFNQNLRNSSSTCGIFASSRLSRSASVRIHVDVRKGHGRARGVGAAPRRRRSNEAIFDREFQFRESHTPAETKKTPDQIPDTKEGFYIFFVYCSEVYLFRYLVIIILVVAVIGIDIFIYNISFSCFCSRFGRIFGLAILTHKLYLAFNMQQY